MTRNSGSERESLAEPCQDEEERDTPFILGHLAEGTRLWKKLRLLILYCEFPAGPEELGARRGSQFKTSI